MEEKQMTVEQVLIETNRVLSSIMLPVGLEQAIDQIRGAIANIQMCIDAYAQVRKTEKNIVAKEEPEIIIEEVKDGNADAE